MLGLLCLAILLGLQFAAEEVAAARQARPGGPGGGGRPTGPQTCKVTITANSGGVQHSTLLTLTVQ